MRGLVDKPQARMRRLWGLTAAAAAFAVQAHAQTAFDLPMRTPGSPVPLPKSSAPRPKRPTPPPPPPADGLGRNGFYIESDSLTRDDKKNTWSAEGGVEARYLGRVVRADKLVYDVATGVVIADGYVQVINPDGTVLSGDHVMLDDRMRAGFARGFAAQDTHNITVAAAVAVRRSATVNELDRAIFTPCDVCASSGKPITPTWSISSSKMIQDRVKHIVIYRNAVVWVKSIPVAYTPVLWHPDPSAPRASGFLIPRIEYNQKLGLSYEQPYVQVISPSDELIVSPEFNTNVNPLLNLEWMKRFYSGRIDIRVGATYDRDFGSNGVKFGPDAARGYILANGAFDLGSNWYWGFTLDRTSDPLLFDKYDVTDVYQNHGMFQSDSERLLSQLYVNRQSANAYFSIAAIDVQGLRQIAVGETEDNRAFPLIAPLVEARYDLPFDVLGGRLRLMGSGVALSRFQQENLADATGPTDNSRRATGEVNWMRTFILPDGLRLDPFLDLRADLYNVNDLSASNTADHTIGRSQETAGLNLTWPFVRATKDETIVLEPIAQFLASPNVKANPNIPNEDSLVFTYDETNLFDPDKFSGYDLFDGGERLNLGGRATIDWLDGHEASVLIGRTLRAQTTDIYPAAGGLNRVASDWVVAADMVPLAGLSLFSRALLNDSYGVDRAEVGMDFAFDRARGYVRYALDNTIPTQRINDIEYGGEVFVLKNWGVSLAGIHDLTGGAWRLRDVGLIYKDDCIRVDVIYQHQDTVEGQLRPSDSVFLRLTLATLADQGYNDADTP